MVEALAWLHPIGGAVAAGLVVWVGLQGLRSRHRASYAVEARTRHRRFAQYIYVYVIAVALFGSTSVLVLRPDLSVAHSVHFYLMTSVVVLMSASAWTSRGAPAVRPHANHAAIGIATLVLVLIGAALGLGLLPG